MQILERPDHPSFCCQVNLNARRHQRCQGGPTGRDIGGEGEHAVHHHPVCSTLHQVVHHIVPGQITPRKRELGGAEEVVATTAVTVIAQHCVLDRLGHVQVGDGCRGHISPQTQSRHHPGASHS
jgi:hypothetical protein